MVKILLILSFLSINNERYTIESSKIEFYSYAPLEDITAINTESIGAIDLYTSEFLIKIPVSAFEFPNKLMQKHFKPLPFRLQTTPDQASKHSREKNKCQI